MSASLNVCVLVTRVTHALDGQKARFWSPTRTYQVGVWHVNMVVT